jgi:hypothetical protein
MTPEEARAVIVEHIIAEAIEDYEPHWEDFPLIGEHAWEDIVVEAERQGQLYRPGSERFDEAYRILADRADRD